MAESSMGSAFERAEQLVVEVIVRNLDRSLAIYTALGFTCERRDGGFAALRWGDRRLFLDEQADLPLSHGQSRANIRVIVPDVDAVWAHVQSLELTIERPIADRYYGVRDFTVRDPNGFGLRFASILAVDVQPPAS